MLTLPAEIHFVSQYSVFSVASCPHCRLNIRTIKCWGASTSLRTTQSFNDLQRQRLYKSTKQTNQKFFRALQYLTKIHNQLSNVFSFTESHLNIQHFLLHIRQKLLLHHFAQVGSQSNGPIAIAFLGSSFLKNEMRIEHSQAVDHSFAFYSC